VPDQATRLTLYRFTVPRYDRAFTFLPPAPAALRPDAQDHERVEPVEVSAPAGWRLLYLPAVRDEEPVLANGPSDSFTRFMTPAQVYEAATHGRDGFAVLPPPAPTNA
jgi:hypothetical protein